MGKTAVLVVGMHRSGTTVVTKALRLMGYDAGKPLGAKYCEHLGIQSVNVDLLRGFDMDWRSLKELPQGWEESALAKQATRKAEDIFRHGFTGEKIVVKDPRLCRTLPVILRAVRDAGYEPTLLMIERNEEEIAQSLHQRDGMSLETGRALCKLYYLDLRRNQLNGARGSTETDWITNYESVLRDWRKALDPFIWDPSYQPSAVDDLIDPSMRHHVAS